MTDLYAKTAQQMLDATEHAAKLNSAPVRALAERIAIAVAGDEQLGGGCDLSAGMFGTRLSTLVVELAGQEAELYALQDQVTGLQELMRQRDELLAKCRKTQKRLVEVADPILQNHGVSVGYFGAAERNVAAIDAMFPGRFDKEDADNAEAPVPITAATAARPSPVDLVVNVINMPRSRGNLTADIQALGIGYATKSMDDFGGTITLHGCTNVPVDLPSWLEVKK